MKIVGRAVGVAVMALISACDQPRPLQLPERTSSAVESARPRERQPPVPMILEADDTDVAGRPDEANLQQPVRQIENPAAETESEPPSPSELRDEASYCVRRGARALTDQQWDRALAFFDHALQCDPQLASAYRQRGDVYCAKEQWPQGLADYQQAVQLTPNDAHSYHQIGLIHGKTKQWDLAIVGFCQAIALQPDNSEAYYLRATAYWQEGDSVQAIVDLTRAIELNPRDAKALKMRGKLYAEQGRGDLAREDFGRSLRLDGLESILLHGRSEAQKR